MKLRQYLLLGALFTTESSFAIKALQSFNDVFKPVANYEVALKNLPPVRSQDSIGLCYSHAAATVFDYHNCRIMKKDCTNLPTNDQASALDMARYTNTPAAGDDNTFRSSYRGINDGGAAAFTLETASLFVGNAAAESCASLDKILSKIGGAKEGTEMQVQAYKRLREKYNKFKGIDPNCESCLTDFVATAKSEIEADFEFKRDQTQMLKAFASDTYEEFFDRLAIPPECNRAKNQVFFEGINSMEMQVHPQGRKGNYQDSLNKMKEVLKAGNPVVLENICMEEKFGSSCKERHALVITGYRKVCAAKDDCYEALRVQNSWGQAWQDSTGGGWVEAEGLLSSTDYIPGHMAWLQDKK